ncbi:MAG: globin [Candidatus Nanopelagicales bacterium]
MSSEWYDAFGGEDFFTDLVAGFYARVVTDDLLRPMYPEDDLGPAERRLRLFLMQYWGGPTTYGDERGHPRLRMRHAPFPVTQAARDRWLELMRASLDDNGADLDEESRERLWQYLVSAADAMVNVNPALE